MHQARVRQPATRHFFGGGDEPHIAADVGRGGEHRLDMVGARGRDPRARVVEHVRDLRSAQAVIDRHDDESRATQPVGDLRARDGVERHPRHAVALSAAEAREDVGDAARPPVQRPEVDGLFAADHRRLVGLGLGMAAQEVHGHTADAKEPSSGRM